MFTPELEIALFALGLAEDESDPLDHSDYYDDGMDYDTIRQSIDWEAQDYE